MRAETAALVVELAESYRGLKPFAVVEDFRGHLWTFLYSRFVDKGVGEDPTEGELDELEAALREKLGEPLIAGPLTL